MRSTPVRTRSLTRTLQSVRNADHQPPADQVQQEGYEVSGEPRRSPTRRNQRHTQRSSSGGQRSLLKSASAALSTVSSGFETASDEVAALCAAAAESAVENTGDGHEVGNDRTGARDIKSIRCGRGRNVQVLSLGTWNCLGLSEERRQYIQAMGYDVMCLTELHGQHKNGRVTDSYAVTRS